MRLVYSKNARVSVLSMVLTSQIFMASCSSKIESTLPTPVAQAQALAYGPTSSLTFSSPTAPADGLTQVTATVLIKDANSVALSGKVVTLTSDRGTSDEISTVVGTTASDGVATFKIQSRKSGLANISATVDSDGTLIPFPPLVSSLTFLAGSVTGLAFTALPVEGLPSTVLSPAPTVTAIDANGNAVASYSTSITIALASNPGSAILSGTKTLVPTAGVSTFSGLSLNALGTNYTLRATSGSYTITSAGFNIVSTLTPPATSTLPISISSPAISVGSQGTISVLVTAADGTPLPGKSIQLTSSRGAVDTITPNPGISNASGLVTFTISSSTPGSAFFTVTNLTDNTTITSSTPTIITFGDFASATGVNGFGLFAGADHSCVLIGGGVKCWGLNTSGQVGNQVTTNQLAPTVVYGAASVPLTYVQSVAPGGSHTCAIARSSSATTNSIQCWGLNTSGQLGNSASTTPSSFPVSVIDGGTGTPISQAKEIAAGDNHTCAIINGGAKCWGRNIEGQLGYSNAVNSSTSPLTVTGLTSGVQSIRANKDNTCAIVNGGLRCWGSNTYGQLGNGGTTTAFSPIAVPGLTSGVRSVAVGYSHTCALSSGTVKCWGLNSSGQIGNGGTTNNSSPQNVTGLTGVSAIAAGSAHTCALTSGKVRCWGLNSNGQLGNNSNTNSSSPVNVMGSVSVELTGVQAIAANGTRTCALMAGGVKCWGGNAAGQLGTGNTTAATLPTTVSSLTNGVQTLATSDFHACAVVNGAAKCWGLNISGQIGNGTPSSTDPVLTPTAVTNYGSGVQSVAVASNHSCGIQNGAAHCWGYNAFGQLGEGTVGQRLAPTAVTNMTAGVTAVQTYGDHTCAIKDGSLFCWGKNRFGQLGVSTNSGTDTANSTPVQVSTLAAGGVESVSTGSSHTCAIVNGAAWCWGRNYYGQLGTGTTTSSGDAPGATPVQVSNLTSGVHSIAAGNFHSCAVKDGGAWCWGYNGYGQLGNNSTTDSSTPVPVHGLSSGVQSISVSYGHSCAVVANGTVCWGNGTLTHINTTTNVTSVYRGMLGNNSSNSYSVPVPVSSLSSGVQGVWTGATFSCALVNGLSRCWGDNRYGQLGNASTNTALVPVATVNLN